MQLRITGMGCLHPLGRDPKTLLDAVLAQDSLPGPELEDFDFKSYFPKSSKRLKKMDPLGRLATTAALLALRSAELEFPLQDRTGLATGTAFGGLEACEAFHRELCEKGPDSINPVHFPNTSHNVACGQVAISFGLLGPVTNVVTGSVAGLDALGVARTWIRRGRTERVLVGGFDRVFPALSQWLEGSSAPGPWAEAAAFLVLESDASAQARGAPVYGTLEDFTTRGSSPGRGEKAERAALEACRQRVEAPQNSEFRSLGSPRAFSGDAPFEPRKVLGETFAPRGLLDLTLALTRSRQEQDPRPWIGVASEVGGQVAGYRVRPNLERS